MDVVDPGPAPHSAFASLKARVSGFARSERALPALDGPWRTAISADAGAAGGTGPRRAQPRISPLSGDVIAFSRCVPVEYERTPELGRFV